MLSLLFVKSSILRLNSIIFVQFRINLILQSSQNEIKMKSSKSQKNISIITDRKIQHELLNSQQNYSLHKGSRTSTNQAHKSPCKNIPMSCKNLLESADINFCKDSQTSDKKRTRHRSTSTKNKYQNNQNQQNRKKQLDFLCFQRIVNQIRKYLIQKQQKWDFSYLCYGQLIRLLWICRFVLYSNEQQFIENNQQGELKKIYLLWLSISVKKIITFKDFLTFVLILENIQVEQQKMETVILNISNDIKQSCLKNYDSFQQDPNYTFFIKKIEFPRKDQSLLIQQSLKQKVIQQFRSFKLNKLKDTGIYECVKVEQEQIVVSKKTNELADHRRKKIQQKIRQKKPHVQNIDLLDLLSYRQRDHIQNFKKSSIPPKKKSVTQHKKGQIKRQLELLSKPKVHFEERRQDEINFSKQEDQFTFHPKINPCKSYGKQKILQIKNADKVLVRMKQARKIKEQKQNIIQKGWSNFQKHQNLKNSSRCKTNQLNYTPNFQSIQIKQKSCLYQKNPSNQQNSEMGMAVGQRQQLEKPKSKLTKYQVSKDYLRIPILYIDVNIEQGKKQRIIIYDNDKAQVLAKQFGQKHKLPEETISRLEVLLQQQMDTVLARIDQQTDDECSIVY